MTRKPCDFARRLETAWKRIGIPGTIAWVITLLTIDPVRTVGSEPSVERNRWEADIAAMLSNDKAAPAPRGGIVFAGSSSIRLWKLEQYFPGRPVLNRGFGGSHVADSIHFADRIILPYQPRSVVIYAGDNDIAAGKSPERVADDFQILVKTIHAKLPNTRIIYISIKPSLARWQLVDTMRRANALIKKCTEEDPRLVYIDIDTPMIGPNGKPKPNLFQEDGLHLSEAGYRLWTQLIQPHLDLETVHP